MSDKFVGIEFVSVLWEHTLTMTELMLKQYRAHNHPIELPHPVAAIEYYLESRGLSRTDFCQMSGIINGRLAEILNKRRALSINLIRKIEAITEIPASVLIQPYELNQYMPHVR